TLGAVVLFLAARPVLARISDRPVLARIREGLQRDGFSYLLAIRLLPIFPFWAVNLAAAFGGMRLGPYTAATFIGIIPGTAVFASIGAGVGDVLARGEHPDLSVIVSPQVLGPLLGLALLSLLPVAWKKWNRTDG
ncbi:MAG: TVP38/TMEM64 family protein, partial [Acetobacteraceae bacterium]|nr:TVP38/TMEM64 family protein [Acetobacteraceae bacterium]